MGLNLPVFFCFLRGRMFIRPYNMFLLFFLKRHFRECLLLLFWGDGARPVSTNTEPLITFLRLVVSSFCGSMSGYIHGLE